MNKKVIFTILIIAILFLSIILYLLHNYDAIENTNQRRNPLIDNVEGSNPSPEKPWPMYKHDLQHTGYTNELGTGKIENYVPLWHRTNKGGSSAIADLNADGKQEVVMITDTGRGDTVYVFSADGSELWTYYSGSDMWHTPAIADINNDDKLEIVVPLRLGKALIALTWDGKLLWRFNTSGRVQNSPAIADINNDGRLEIIFGDGHISREEDKPSHVYAIISDGDSAREVWRYATPLGGYITSSFPAVVDINDDGKLETVIGVHGPGGIINPDYSYITALDSKGKEIWRYTVNTDVGVPTVGDLDGDGDLEILFSEFGGDGKGTLYCLDKIGMKLWDFPLSGGGSMHSPSIADFNSDGKLEIVVTCNKKSESHVSKIYMLSHKGKIIWKYTREELSSLTQYWDAPSIADLNGDGKLEIITGYYFLDYEADPSEVIKKGVLTIINEKGKILWEYVFSDPQTISCILIADLNGDGTLEISVTTGGNVVEGGFPDDPPYYEFYFWLSPSEGVWIFGDASQTNLQDQFPNLFIEERNILVVEEDPLHMTIVVAIYNLGHLTGTNNVVIELRTNRNLTLIASKTIDLSTPVSWTKIEVEYTAISNVPRTFWIEVDPLNSISESNERDNQAYTTTE
jgi:hypothetical protein